MGLLDDVLGQLTGGEREANASATRSQTGGSGMGGAMAALLPVVLQMLASSGRGQQPGRGATTGGGLEDLRSSDPERRATGGVVPACERGRHGKTPRRTVRRERV